MGSSHCPSDDMNHYAYNNGDNNGKVLCGHLFNANHERDNLNLVNVEGEECPISLEPIADARLPFSDKIRVNLSNPELTGVQLLCGHRFSAVFLLWHWVLSPMICPMCRAEYCLGNVSKTSEVKEPRPCHLENFPHRHWGKLRSVFRAHKQEEEREERRLIQSYHTESVLDETFEVVLGPAQQFFLMLSLSNGDGLDIIQYMPLHRTNDNISAITDDVFEFTVQRPSLRRFTSAISNFNSTQSTHALDPSVNPNGNLCLLQNSVVLRVGDDHDEHSYLFRVAQLADISLPVFRMNDLANTDIPVWDLSAALSVSEAANILSGMRQDSVDGVVHGTTNESENSSMNPLPPLQAISATDSLTGSSTSTSGRNSIYRYTTVQSPCIDMHGSITLELCEAARTERVESLHAVRLSLQACSLLSEVARCFTT
jgi:hypothetical protein